MPTFAQNIEGSGLLNLITWLVLQKIKFMTMLRLNELNCTEVARGLSEEHLSY